MGLKGSSAIAIIPLVLVLMTSDVFIQPLCGLDRSASVESVSYTGVSRMRDYVPTGVYFDACSPNSLCGSVFTPHRITPYAGENVDIVLENEGMNLAGTITYPENLDRPCPAVLLLPGFMGERDELPVTGTYVASEGGRPQGMLERTASKLAEAGCVSLRIDYRCSGKSEGYWQDVTLTGELSDVDVALRYLAGNPAVDKDRIAVVGYSMGGALAACSTQNPLVRVVVLWSAVPDPASIEMLLSPEQRAELGAKGMISMVLPWGESTTLKKAFFDSCKELDPVEDVAGFNGPLLVVSCLNDTMVAPQPDMSMIFMDAHEGPESLITLNADHTYNVFAGPERLDVAISETIAWLNEWL